MNDKKHVEKIKEIETFLANWTDTKIRMGCNDNGQIYAVVWDITLYVLMAHVTYHTYGLWSLPNNLGLHKLMSFTFSFKKQRQKMFRGAFGKWSLCAANVTCPTWASTFKVTYRRGPMPKFFLSYPSMVRQREKSSSPTEHLVDTTKYWSNKKTTSTKYVKMFNFQASTLKVHRIEALN